MKTTELTFKTGMEKAEKTLHLLKHRTSTREFDSRPVEQEKLDLLFESLRWAPSSSNLQPWNMIYALKGSEAYDKLFDALLPGNQEWAEEVPMLYVTVAEMNRKPGKPNRHAFHDVGQAIAHMTTVATAMGLKMRQMAGFSPEKVKEHFNIPEGYEPVAYGVIGYAANEEETPEALQEQELGERGRKPVDEFVFENAWKKSKG